MNHPPRELSSQPLKVWSVTRLRVRSQVHAGWHGSDFNEGRGRRR